MRGSDGAGSLRGAIRDTLTILVRWPFMLVGVLAVLLLSFVWEIAIIWLVALVILALMKHLGWLP
jgi:hypothetical protein